MPEIRIISLMPYKILPARLGGEKGIALFSEYLGKEVRLTGISTRSNDVSAAKNFTVRNILTDHRIRYANPFLFFTVRRIIKEEKATHLLIEHPYYGWLAWLVRLFTPITWVVHSHNIEFERSRSIGRWWWKALKWYETWVYKRADINFFISDDDRNFAIQKMGIEPSKSHTITYGVEIAGLPSDRENCKERICKMYGLTSDTILLLFNGSLFHHSNHDAVKVIIDEINPALLTQPLPYRIIICGKGLPDSFGNLKAYADKNVIYAGFVDDVSLYFKAADLFLNPIMSGAGIKTKAVEAIAYNCQVVSTKLGALGMDRDACNGKLDVVADGDWKNFAHHTITRMKEAPQTTTEKFYTFYFWGNIAKKVVHLLQNHSSRSGH